MRVLTLAMIIRGLEEGAQCTWLLSRQGNKHQVEKYWTGKNNGLPF